MVIEFVPRSSPRAARAMAIALVALALLAMPALAGDVEETRSTVEFGPDLAVSASDITLSKPVLMAGVDFNVSIRVYNLGDEDASGVTVDLLIDTEPVDSRQLDQILVDGWAMASFDWALSQGDHTIGFLVDGNDAIDEKREDNNDASLDVRVKGLPDASVTDSDLSVSSAHPMEGDVLTIDAMVHNLGESAATLVVVSFWDGVPGVGTLIANETTSIPSMGSKLVSTQWDTSGLGGTHVVNVYISRVSPDEDNVYNNMASITVLIFTHWDLVIDANTGDKVIDQEYTQDGFVTVREGATLTISATEFEFLQDYENQFALFVEDGGTLVLEDAIVWSRQPLLVIMGDGTSLQMSAQSQLWATIILQGNVQLSVVDSIVDGGLEGTATKMTIDNSEITGQIDLSGGSLDATDSLLSSPYTAYLWSTHAVLIDSKFSEAADTSLALFEGSTAELRNVTCQGIEADSTSTAMVFRRVEVVVEDESTLVIPESTIEITHFINGSVVGTATGGEDGRAFLEVLSDVISDGEAHFIGNYIIRSTFAGKVGTEPLLLTPYPAMTDDANMPEAVVVLPPVDPRSLIASTPGDLEITAGQTMDLVADFVQDGNIVVHGTLSIAATSTLSILQDRDHQYYILVESGGTLDLRGGAITSDYPINVYLSGTATLEMGPGSTLDVTTLVAEGGSTVDASASTMNARLLIRGGDFVMENACVVNGDMMIVETPSVEINGGEISVVELHIDSPAASIDAVTITADEVEISSSFANITDSSLTVGKITVDANILTVTGSDISAKEPLDMGVATLYMDSSSSNMPLASSRTGSKVYLYDAEVPSPFSLGNATVLVYWYLTVQVQDKLSNPVSGVDVDISFTNNDTAVTNGVTNDDGQVRFPLMGSVVTPAGEYFIGNYRIVAHHPKTEGEKVTRYVNLDQAKSMIAKFPDSIVPPTMIGVQISVQNTTVIAGTEFVVSGLATAIFPTVRSPLYEGDVEVQMSDNGSTWTNLTTLDENGMFHVVIPAPLTDGVYYITALVTPTGDFEGTPAGRSNIITMEIEPPGPTSLYIVLETTKMEDFPAGGMLTIRGTVKYNTAQGAPASNVRVFLDDPISRQKYQTVADGLGAFTFPPRIGPAFYGQYDYILTARDDDLGIETAEPAKLTVIAVEVEEEVTEDNTWLLWTILIVVIAVAAIGGTLGYWAFSSKGRMVECGECGTLVPDTATECPKCGIEFEVEVAKCSECESWIRSDASTCPYCGTPFRDLEEEGEEGAEPPEEGDEGDVVAEVPESEEEMGGLDEAGIVVDEGDLKASPEAAKEVPEGLKKEVRPRPVVQKKAVMPKDEEAEPNGTEEGENGQVVRPRVVRKVAAPPPEEPEEPEAPPTGALDEGFDLEEGKEDI
ncbi:MAG: hypothetical protein JSW25_09150 [Thermoplasmata archaeon]|nr:MAG: hypothetical protein JSW25_09150 [Thermoplasmata archaeon]